LAFESENELISNSAFDAINELVKDCSLDYKKYDYERLSDNNRYLEYHQSGSYRANQIMLMKWRCACIDTLEKVLNDGIDNEKYRNLKINIILSLGFIRNQGGFREDEKEMVNNIIDETMAKDNLIKEYFFSKPIPMPTSSKAMSTNFENVVLKGIISLGHL